jgi:hypothetical protein
MPGANVDGLLRSCVAAMCLAAGVLHVSAAADHRGMGGHVAFFVLIAMAQTALAASVAWGRSAGWLTLAALGNLAVALVWVLSRTTGLPVDGSSTPEAMGFKDGIATLLELGAVAGAGMWWLLPDSARQLPLQSRRLAWAMLGTGVWALGASGLFAGHTHSAGHTHGAGHGHGTHPVNGAAHLAAPEAGDGHGDHGHPAATAAAVAPTTGGHHHSDGAGGPAVSPAAHHHEHTARPVGSVAASGSHDGGHHDVTAASPVPHQASGHRHATAVGGPAPAGDDDGHDGAHDHDGNDDHHGTSPDRDDRAHDHDHDGSAEDRDDGEGGSALDELLKLIQPR